MRQGFQTHVISPLVVRSQLVIFCVPSPGAFLWLRRDASMPTAIFVDAGFFLKRFPSVYLARREGVDFILDPNWVR
jgi:hypothetical protein